MLRSAEMDHSEALSIDCVNVLHVRLHGVVGLCYHSRYGTDWRRSRSVLPFSKLNKVFFGYFDLENIFLDKENN